MKLYDISLIITCGPHLGMICTSYSKIGDGAFLGLPWFTASSWITTPLKALTELGDLGPWTL